MMEEMSDNNQLVTIEATLVTETEKSYLLGCEGDEAWFPKKFVTFKGDSLTLPKWLYREKFPDEPV